MDPGSSEHSESAKPFDPAGPDFSDRQMQRLNELITKAVTQSVQASIRAHLGGGSENNSRKSDSSDSYNPYHVGPGDEGVKANPPNNSNRFDKNSN